jgi:hypothetical protein
MKTLLVLVGLTTCFSLGGCARDLAQATTKTTSQPPPTLSPTFATGTAPLSYQWQFNGTNVSGLSQPPSTPSPAFNVNVTGTAPLTYQWRFDGTNVSGTNISVLTLTNIGTNTSGMTNP